MRPRPATTLLDQSRIKLPPDYASPAGVMFGGFMIPCVGVPLKVVSSGSSAKSPWEHVSVSCQGRTPTWEEMCYVKNLFWEGEEAVMQLHPPVSQYVNHHPYCLHLWKPVAGSGLSIPLPPPDLVGPRKGNHNDKR